MSGLSHDVIRRASMQRYQTVSCAVNVMDLQVLIGDALPMQQRLEAPAQEGRVRLGEHVFGDGGCAMRTWSEGPPE